MARGSSDKANNVIRGHYLLTGKMPISFVIKSALKRIETAVNRARPSEMDLYRLRAEIYLDTYEGRNYLSWRIGRRDALNIYVRPEKCWTVHLRVANKNIDTFADLPDRSRQDVESTVELNSLNNQEDHHASLHMDR